MSVYCVVFCSSLCSNPLYFGRFVGLISYSAYCVYRLHYTDPLTWSIYLTESATFEKTLFPRQHKIEKSFCCLHDTKKSSTILANVMKMVVMRVGRYVIRYGYIGSMCRGDKQTKPTCETQRKPH